MGSMGIAVRDLTFWGRGVLRSPLPQNVVPYKGPLPRRFLETLEMGIHFLLLFPYNTVLVKIQK